MTDPYQDPPQQPQGGPLASATRPPQMMYPPPQGGVAPLQYATGNSDPALTAIEGAEFSRRISSRRQRHSANMISAWR